MKNPDDLLFYIDESIVALYYCYKFDIISNLFFFSNLFLKTYEFDCFSLTLLDECQSTVASDNDKCSIDNHCEVF